MLLLDPGIHIPGYRMPPRSGLKILAFRTEIHIPGYTMPPRLGLGIFAFRLPRKPRRIDFPTHDADAPRVRLELGGGDRD